MTSEVAGEPEQSGDQKSAEEGFLRGREVSQEKLFMLQEAYLLSTVLAVH